MKLFSIHRPFELLAGLRDGQLTNVEQLTTRASAHKVVAYARRLHACGIALFNTETGELIPDKKFFNVLGSIGIGLSNLAEYEWSSAVVNPLFGEWEFQQNARHGISVDVFILMPFSEQLFPIFEDHLKPAAEAMGLSCARADDVFTTSSIIADIWMGIKNARVVVADCSGKNPNVFYEIGIAHTIGKPVVLLAQSTDDLPFDLRHRRAIIYEYTPRGMKELERALSQTVKRILTEKTDDRPQIPWQHFVDDDEIE